MENINGKWMHDGNEYEVVEGKCNECPFRDGVYCKLTPSKCSEDLGRGKRFKLKENQNMIRPFKCAAMTPERVAKMKQALVKRVENVKIFPSLCDKDAFYVGLNMGKEFFYHINEAVEEFLQWDYEEMTFDQAMQMILAAPVLKNEPVFDIKLRDEVLCRDSSVYVWEIKHFARPKALFGFQTFDSFFYQMLPFKNNEHLHGTDDTPDGWWEVKDGKPVWVKK